MSLNKDRKNYLTASQAHVAMADYELELEGIKMSKPSFDEVSDCDVDTVIKHIASGGSKLVRDINDSLGIKISGKEKDVLARYIKATTPVFSTGMETAARMIAMGSIFKNRSDSDGFKSPYMERGNDLELDAIESLEQHTGLKFSNTGDSQTFLTDGDLGVTPDGIEYDGFDIVSCAEVKNPKDETHMKYLTLVTDQESLLEVEPRYYWQAMCGLAVTGAKCYHWLSRHEDAEEQYRIVYVKITPNDEHIRILRSRASKILVRSKDIIKTLEERYN